MVRRCVVGGLITFLLFQPEDMIWELKRTISMVLIVFTQPQNCVLGIQKKWFDETVLLSAQNTCP